MPSGTLLPSLLLLAAVAPPVPAETREPLVVRGKAQTLHLYGPRDGRPAVVASGDGGWIHLGVEAAAFLASQGYFVVGVDSKAYLSSFTSGSRTLAASDVPADFRVFVDRARSTRPEPVPLVGVSEGAGLSVLAASDPELRKDLLGVLGLGLPNENELGWRWRDAIIYLTKKAPNEPGFKAADYVPRLLDLPLAAIHSTHDEFVPLEEVKALMSGPGGPRRLWVLEAPDHRFSGRGAELNRRILEALEWMRTERR